MAGSDGTKTQSVCKRTLFHHNEERCCHTSHRLWFCHVFVIGVEMTLWQLKFDWNVNEFVDGPPFSSSIVRCLHSRKCSFNRCSHVSFTLEMAWKAVTTTYPIHWTLETVDSMLIWRILPSLQPNARLIQRVSKLHSDGAIKGQLFFFFCCKSFK